MNFVIKEDTRPTSKYSSIFFSMFQDTYSEYLFFRIASFLDYEYFDDRRIAFPRRYISFKESRFARKDTIKFEQEIL